MRNELTRAGLVLSLVAFAACGGGGGGGSGGGGDPQSTLDFTYEGLTDLGAAFVYEGWLIVGGDPVSTGRFTVDGAGVPSETSFEVDESDAQSATAFILTLEPAVGDDPAPSDVRLLAGDIAAGAARLSVGHASAIGTDFSAAAGSYVLAAPTSPDSGGGMTDDDYFSGIWFLDPTGPAPSLTLPALPAGWTYEGWVVVGGIPRSTGRFSDATASDSDLAGPFAGMLAPPAFPGQDFVSGTVLDLRAGSAVVSVEPVPDNSPAPFLLKPLVDPTIDDRGASVSQILSNQAAANNPTGTLSIDGAAVPALTTAVVGLSLTGLGDLGPIAFYEGWLVGPSGSTSIGAFSIDATGRPSFSAFSVGADVAAAATEFVVTIELTADPDPTPSATKVLAGTFAGGSPTADLTVGHGSAVGADFLGATGLFILAAPTTPLVGGVDIDYASGIWFLDPTGPAPGLILPPLSFGWRYEGWVVIGGMPFSTGRFDLPGGPDDDGPGPGAGTDPAPGFPGQDFITGPALVLPGGAALVSVEPEPDNDPLMPFAIQPLGLGTIADPGLSGVVQAMANQAATNIPTGTATIQ